MKIKTIEEFLKEAELNEIASEVKDYKKILDVTLKGLTDLVNKPKSGNLRQEFKDAGLEYDGDFLKVQNKSVEDILDIIDFVEDMKKSLSFIK